MAKNRNTKKQVNKNFVIILSIFIIAIVAYLIYDSVKKPDTIVENIFKKEGEVSFFANNGSFIKKIDVEIADNEYERQKGMMFRRSMEEYQGMLFIFPIEERLSFWMRNTLISLDIIFINSSFQIVTIHKNAETLSDKSYPSTEIAKYVVEVIAGFTDKYNIKVGDSIKIDKSF